jgi:hypothetical protein
MNALTEFEWIDEACTPLICDHELKTNKQAEPVFVHGVEAFNCISLELQWTTGATKSRLS